MDAGAGFVTSRLLTGWQRDSEDWRDAATGLTPPTRYEEKALHGVFLYFLRFIRLAYRQSGNGKKKIFPAGPSAT